MNENVKKVVEKIELIAGHFQKLPSQVDNALAFMKKPIIGNITEVVNVIASKFCGIIFSLFTLVFIILCAKNLLVSMMFKDVPRGIIMGFIVLGLVAIVINNYIIYKMENVFARIINTSQCRISSLNIFSIMTLIILFLALSSFFAGIYMAIEFKSFILAVYGSAAMFFFILLALYNSTPENFAITEDENASAGEDLITLVTFTIKVLLRLIPIIILVVSIIGICQSVPELFSLYTESETTYSGVSRTYLKTHEMIAMMSLLSGFLLIGVLPIFAYLYYLINYICIDLVRAILSLPHKLDDLKK